jgi:hypothetical protein
MITQTSITLPLPAYAWQVDFARVEQKPHGIFRLVAMRDRLPLQGCYSMTD